MVSYTEYMDWKFNEPSVQMSLALHLKLLFIQS